MSHTAPTYVAQPDDPFLVFNLPLFDFSEPSFEFFVTQTICKSVIGGWVFWRIYMGRSLPLDSVWFLPLCPTGRVHNFVRVCPSYKTGYCLHGLIEEICLYSKCKRAITIT